MGILLVHCLTVGGRGQWVVGINQYIASLHGAVGSANTSVCCLTVPCIEAVYSQVHRTHHPWGNRNRYMLRCSACGGPTFKLLDIIIGQIMRIKLHSCLQHSLDILGVALNLSFS